MMRAGWLVMRSLIVTLSVALLAAAAVLVLVMAAGGRSHLCGPEAGAPWSVPLTLWQLGLELVAPGGGQAWDCQPLRPYLWQAVKVSAWVLLVLFLVLAVASFSVWRAWRRNQPEGTHSASLLLLAPPVVWGTALAAGANLLVLLLLAPVVSDVQPWLFPDARLELKVLAAGVVLVFGGGMVFDVRATLATSLQRVYQEDFMAVAVANGLSARSRLLRNLALPVATGLLSRFPQVLGELIVVDYLFVMGGFGFTLKDLADQRDAMALMGITVVLVGITMALRTGLEGLSQWLLPPMREDI